MTLEERDKRRGNPPSDVILVPTLRMEELDSHSLFLSGPSTLGEQ